MKTAIEVLRDKANDSMRKMSLAKQKLKSLKNSDNLLSSKLPEWIELAIRKGEFYWRDDGDLNQDNSSEVRREVVGLLRDLGFSVEFSCSSSWSNERIFVKPDLEVVDNILRFHSICRPPIHNDYDIT